MADFIEESRDTNNSYADQPRLGLVIASSTAESNFPAPLGWRVSSHVVEPLTFETHTSPRSDPGPAIITFSDVGQSETAFAPFFQYCRQEDACPQLELASVHYHTCFPGHFTDSPSLSPSDDSSLDAIVQAISTLIDFYQINRLVGLGIGLGGTMLLRANAKHPKIFSGLFLISPIIAPASIIERVTQTADDLVSSSLGLGLTRRVKDRFIARWVSDSTREHLFSAVQILEEDLDRRNPTNVTKMLSQEAWRGDSSQCIEKVTSRVMLATGKESQLRYHVNDAFELFDPKQSTWLDLAETGSLVHDEMPDQLGQALSLFLQTISGFI